jgi:hypothetical protein
MKVPDNRIINDKVSLIPLKRGIEGVGIDYDNEKDYAGGMRI